MVVTKVKQLIPHGSPIRLLWHKTKALIAALNYWFPGKKLTVIGVTGTDGKTTTVGMITHILQQNGLRVGALSTALFQIGMKIEMNSTQKTSPSPFSIQKFLKRLVDADCTHAVLEYSSHGLMQGRTMYTYPLVGAFTNISPEHLDYHGTMEAYIDAKGLLFSMLRPDGTKVLNRDDRSYATYAKIPTGKTISYSVKTAIKEPPTATDIALYATDIKATPTGVEAVLHCNAIEEKPDTPPLTIVLSTPGAFNIANALCAISATCAANISIPSALKALSTFQGIPGRMERIDEGLPFNVYIDFTVTPFSYESTLSSLKPMLAAGKRLLVLTGSCGDRMQEKRPEIGKIVSTYADVCVVTNEDPYTEDPEKIINEVWAGIDQTKTKAVKMTDRKEAMIFLLKEAQAGDIVVMCGKGSDTTMWMKTGQVPWNEREIVRGLLQELKKTLPPPTPPVVAEEKKEQTPKPKHPVAHRKKTSHPHKKSSKRKKKKA